MKRDRDLLLRSSSSSCSKHDTGGVDMVINKGWQQQDDAAAGGLDELLAVLGYKVRESDMVEVAQKLEQLEGVIGSSQQTGLSHLATDTVHYNPSDLSSWIETMLVELNPNPLSNFEVPLPSVSDHHAFFDPAESSSVITSIDCNADDHMQMFVDSSCDYDLKAIPGQAVYGSREASPKRMKLGFPSSSWAAGGAMEPLRPLLVVDSQENGIRLVHTLTACAEAVQQENLQLAEAFLKQIGPLASTQAGPMGKVAAYFADALKRRIYGFYSGVSLDSSLLDTLQMHFYDACPYLKFGHFTANQAILEAIDGQSSVHIIDLSMNQGMQWPALMQALAMRSDGPPSLRLTVITHHLPDSDVGDRLAKFAETINIDFSYRGFGMNSPADLDPAFLDIRPGEAIAVNSVFELHRLLAVSGSVEKLLSAVKSMKPSVFTVVEQEANHNGALFLDRFMESLHYYSALFDSMEGCGWPSPVTGQDRAMSELYLGQQICNVVACEGEDRFERHETLVQWRTRFESAGFLPFHLGSNAFKQASTLLMLEGGDGYHVEEDGGCLMLNWHTRPLIATSAWQLAEGATDH